jgi:holo-[acyl-carrier protein] synthase
LRKEDERQKYEYLASRWALKEAMVKAMGRADLEYKGIYLKKPEGGRPHVEMCGEKNLGLVKELGIVKIHSSISHEEEYAVAFVTLESDKV